MGRRRATIPGWKRCLLETAGLAALSGLVGTGCDYPNSNVSAATLNRLRSTSLPGCDYPNSNVSAACAKRTRWVAKASAVPQGSTGTRDFAFPHNYRAEASAVQYNPNISTENEGYMDKCLCWKRPLIILLSNCAAIASSAQTFTTPQNFDRTNGANPYYVSLVQGTDGNFYGTTSSGGSNTYGTVFKITPSGTLTTLRNFDGAHGALPYAGLILATDGNFYCTASRGGTHHNGRIFKITPEGVLTALHSFDAIDGANPSAPLVQASNGDFYGVALEGANGYGTIFRITPGGGFLNTLQL